ncbi:MAG: bifunctional adenosylcobinamide kinase/adenosylcobinamide-phosphate guanylyltransferase [Clostridia bacterium]
MRVLISGGCKQGKSTHAQYIARAQQTKGGALYYVATMRAGDAEDHARIARHVQERAGWGFTTLEQPKNILACLARCDPTGSFLLDSTTALLANEMFRPDGSFDAEAGGRVCEALCTLTQRLPKLVLVSDGIYHDAARFDPMTEAYRRALAAIDCALAKRCDQVLEVCAGQVVVWKGREEMGV